MKEKNDMRTMQQQEKEFNERQLSLQLPAVCRSLGYLCEAIEKSAGRPSTCPNQAQGCVDKGCDLAGCEGLGVKA